MRTAERKGRHAPCPASHGRSMECAALWMGAFTDFRNESLLLDDRKRARFCFFHGILRGVQVHSSNRLHGFTMREQAKKGKCVFGSAPCCSRLSAALLFQLSVKRAILSFLRKAAERCSIGALFSRRGKWTSIPRLFVKARFETVRFARSGSPFAEAAGLRMIGRPAD